MLTWLLFAFVLSPAVAHGSEPIEIWPDRPPGAKPNAKQTNDLKTNNGTVRRVRRVGRPELTVHQPPADKRSGAAVVVCPGGGYYMLAFEKEGTRVAEWLNSLGVTAFVLKYRVPRAKRIAHWKPPLMDAQRALRYVRHNASKWQVDRDRLGMLGFSAGGHLVATTSTHFDKPAYQAIDEIDKASPRPNFSILIYPAYMTVNNKGQKLAPEINVTKDTPPAW
jgi:acetyl esterase/lipase